MTQDFWLTSGWHLLIRDENGHMVPTVEFMRAYFMRDEVAPEAQSCPAEEEGPMFSLQTSGTLQP